MSQPPTTDLRSCDREVIHLTPAIQGHGALLAFNRDEGRVEIHSANAPEILGLNPKELVGARMEHIFGTAFSGHVFTVAEHVGPARGGRHLSMRPVVKGRVFDAYWYLSDGLNVLELEPYAPRGGAGEHEIQTEQILRDYTREAMGCRDVAELSLLVCRTVRRVTGLDRVMMYRFVPPEWYGEVIAEDRVTHAHSYLNHRFPATDIPLPARSLYLRNGVRLIPDVTAPISPLVPSENPLTRKPLDMTDSRLRTVSPIHLEYLRNMKVGASFSVAITHHGKLWGLITCHHLTPMFVPQSLRTACEIIAQAFSVQAPIMEESRELRDRADFDFKVRRILENLRRSERPVADLFQQHRTVTECFGAAGIAYVTKGLQDFAGVVPLRQETEALAAALRPRLRDERGGVIALDRLADLGPSWENRGDGASGVLAAMIPDVHESVLMIFRPEFRQMITWGGDPRKTLDKREFQGRINPRLSFEAWAETITGRSLPWRKYEVDGISFLRDFVFETLETNQTLLRDLSKLGP